MSQISLAEADAEELLRKLADATSALNAACDDAQVILAHWDARISDIGCRLEVWLPAGTDCQGWVLGWAPVKVKGFQTWCLCGRSTTQRDPSGRLIVAPVKDARRAARLAFASQIPTLLAALLLRTEELVRQAEEA